MQIKSYDLEPELYDHYTVRILESLETANIGYIDLVGTIATLVNEISEQLGIDQTMIIHDIENISNILLEESEE